MFVYSPENILPERLAEAKKILQRVPYKHAFITGSFLYEEEYNDIDVFIISRTKKTFEMEGCDVHFIDFNQASSLFFHSVTKQCVSKSVIPVKKLRVRVSDYWELLNEILTPVAGDANMKKEARMAILYTVYLSQGVVLDSYSLKKYSFEKNDLECFLFNHAPSIFQKHMSLSYLKRFFYSRTKYYEEAEPVINSLIREIIPRKVSS